MRIINIVLLLLLLLLLYIAGERVGPKPISVGEDTNSQLKEAVKARKKNLAWIAV